MSCTARQNVVSGLPPPPLSHTQAASRPPGRVTRAISESPATGSAAQLPQGARLPRRTPKHLHRGQVNPSSRPRCSGQVGGRRQELDRRDQGDRCQVVAEVHRGPRPPPGRGHRRGAAGVRDPRPGPGRPEDAVQPRAEGLPSAQGQGDRRRPDRRPGAGGQHLQHRPVDRGERLRDARGPQAALRLRQRRPAGAQGQGQRHAHRRPQRGVGQARHLTLADLVKQVDVDKQDASAVAKDFLTKNAPAERPPSPSGEHPAYLGNRERMPGPPTRACFNRACAGYCTSTSTSSWPLSRFSATRASRVGRWSWAVGGTRRSGLWCRPPPTRRERSASGRGCRCALPPAS